MNEDKKKIIIALKKARTSLDKIIIKIENDNSQCFDVIQQNLSVIGLIKNANNQILGKHLNNYIDNVANKEMSKDELIKMKDEIVKIVQNAQNK